MPFARRALGNAAPRANKKKERKRKGRTHRYSIGWKGRTEQSWGWSRTCFFSSSFCCVRVKMCKVPFSLSKEKGKEKRILEDKRGFRVSLHPKLWASLILWRGDTPCSFCTKRRHRKTPSGQERGKEEEEEEEEEEESANGNGPARRVSFCFEQNDCGSRELSFFFFCVLFSSCRARRTKTRSSSASLA